ncbi:MAG: hypothetical protein ONB07_07205 [candidate division KSB1 bacterium]|nr:hypothetical protein [candidate division KSB1 bacterium]MDZ7412423.1 hypothetical protein [candidate division KSB1 bacterium]
MQLRKPLAAGTISGLVMGISLFIGGAIFSRIIYGPQFAPPGKFRPEQLNAFYFLWTKLAIGWFFGSLFAFVCEMLPLKTRMIGIPRGLKYGFVFWVLISLWSLSHPLVYGTLNARDQTFWLLYQLVGFLTLGATLGSIYRTRAKRETTASGCTAV